MRRPPLLAPALALLLTLLAGGPALAALRLGTDGPDALVGTHKADHLTGHAGDDALTGLAGDDVYYFADGWGTDTLEEKARHRVGRKRLPGGTDTLSFQGVIRSPVVVALIRQWGPGWNGAGGPGGQLDLGRSIVENAVGGAGDDFLTGGGEDNTLQPGGGTLDRLSDYGGMVDGVEGRPGLPASDDVYKGFGRHAGMVWVQDWGGAGDVLDLRPFSAADVYVGRVDLDGGGGGTKESLQVVTSATTQVLVLGHFSEYRSYTRQYGQQGRVETLLFADGTIGTVGVASAAAATGKQEALAAAADGLAEQARASLAELPAPGELPAGR